MPGGGPTTAKPIPYSTPQGPSEQMRQGPGLGGDNHDCGEEGTSEHMTGSPGIGGTNHGNKCNQGRH